MKLLEKLKSVSACVVLCLATAAAPAHEFDVLVFSKTAGFRHGSIGAGIAAIQDLAAANDFGVTATEDASQFTLANLGTYDAVIFLNTTGNILDAAQKAAFEQYIQAGGGFVGIHSASDTEYSWPWYAGLIGAYFRGHPPGTPNADVLVLDRAHPSTSFLPRRWNRTDEWYNFRTNPRGDVHVLGVVDEDSYSGGTMGQDHPIMWCHDYDGGRAWYTAMGHTSGSYSEPQFRQHILEGIKWAAGDTAGDCGATVNENFEKVVLDTNVFNPIALDVADDGKVYFIERGGSLKIYDPVIGSTLPAGGLSVFTGGEDGLIGVALDPDFATNAWIYLMYSPAGAVAKQHVSRFTLSGSTLDTASEVVLLEIPTQREQCCHSGGALLFDPDGNLFIATGDNTNPFESGGAAPIDERPGRGPWDAQKSASNTDDLRGKILKIKPEADGSYTIPAGNLFPADGSAGRPEIYIMGVRNPFRIAVDPMTGWLYWGEVGPDAANDSAVRGPRGYDEVNQARLPGNFGWPYITADNQPYNDYDFATSTGGAPFDPAAPVNDSPNNTGATSLPPAQPAWIWYHSGVNSDWPEMGEDTARTIMAGPVYQYAPGRSFPPYFDQTLFVYEWSRNYIKEVKLDDTGAVLDIVDVVPELELNRPIDMKFGPDGAMYIIEWGSGFGGNNPDARIVKVRYNKGNSLPVAIAGGAPTSGATPLVVQFTGSDSFDPDGGAVSYAWDFDLDGSVDSTAADPLRTYTVAGNYTAQLRVTDDLGESTTANVPISAGNFAPTVSFTEPVENGFFDWGDQMNYAFQVDDVEDGSTGDGSISCDDVTVDLVLGHDSHGHTLTQTNGCAGSYAPASDHDPDANVYFAIEALYTDQGAPGVNPVQGVGTRIVQPKCKQAQYFDAAQGVSVALTQDSVGG
ncbi:MAG: PKD domain-containing protein, partial [Gammaproteobacteria bacterium]|nr:PKD domain-containing protein [Gammaproteobacteria bacterium]